MSFEAPLDREQPELTTVASYALSRLSYFPTFHVRYAETVRAFEKAQVTAASESTPGNGFDVLVIEEWANRTDLVGKEVFDESKNVIATVVDAVTNPEQVDGDGNVTSPAQLVLTLDVPLGADPTGSMILVRRYNPLGLPLHEVSKGGRTWEIVFDARDPEVRARMAKILYDVMFSILKSGFEEAGIPKPDEEIHATVQSLSAKGYNIDTFITMACEDLERERRQGTLAYTDVYGQAPVA